jgi:hypothetical protein
MKMNFKLRRLPPVVAVLAMLAYLASAQSALAQRAEQDTLGADPAGEELRVHDLGEVPAAVMSAARGAAPDVYFQSAESYWQDDFRVYRLTGRLFREVWNVYVREDGVLLRSESDNQDD